jgi:GDP-mannose 6-dehydrogenase
MKVAVFGLGYVGTVTAAGLASHGHDVVGVDVDRAKVDAINAGDSPVVEPGIAELLGAAVAAGHLRATADARDAVAGAEVSLVCVGTPSGSHGETDLTFVSRALLDLRAAMAEVAPPAGGRHAVVVRSTVPPGTVTRVVSPLFAPGEVPHGWTVGTAMCPEFLREGCSVEDFFDPPFVVVGTAEEATAAAVRDLFGFLDRDVDHVSVATAEALKFSCNAFHATKVSFANEMARVFRPYGVDTREVMTIFCRDTKLNIAPTYLRPGFAYGGSCLPKDLRSLQHLARSQDVDVPLLAGTALTNELVVRDVVERVIDIGDRRVCLLGLSFKSDTDDLRESPNVELAERLLGKGFDVRIYDPIVNPDRLVGANRRHVEAKLPHLNRLLACTPEQALDGAGVAIVTTSDRASLAALTASPPPHVVDLHGRLGGEVELLDGYQGAGW